MLGSTSLEVYSSILFITEKNTKFELYTDLVDELPFSELKGELEEIPEIPNISPKYLQDKIIGPRINEAKN